MPGGVDGCKKGAGFQRRYLHSGRIRGGITQLPGDATAVIGCWTWVKRAFILPILYTQVTDYPITRRVKALLHPLNSHPGV